MDFYQFIIKHITYENNKRLFRNDRDNRVLLLEYRCCFYLLKLLNNKYPPH